MSANPIDPTGMAAAAEKLWHDYAELKFEDFMAQAQELAHLSDDDKTERVPRLLANVQQSRQQSFLDGFAMGCSFLAGAVAAKRDDSGNNPDGDDGSTLNGPGKADG